jgi:hypothetical protein
MGGRGRLIQQFYAEIARIDTTSTRSGGYYDDDFRTVVSSDAATGDGLGTKQRQEHAAVLIPCQIGSLTWSELKAFDLGNVPRGDMILRMHFRDLERLSLVDASGEAMIRPGDRLVSIRNFLTGAVIQQVKTPPGLYVLEATPTGWGIDMTAPTRNLLRVSFRARDADV